ncbi:hypothetical protein [Escherichia coli]|uniref:hypothetical protein n=1 Tax=Escherichia coli TaxID=562 RepID=UPI002FCD4E29
MRKIHWPPLQQGLYAAAQQYLNRVMLVSMLTGRGFLTTHVDDERAHSAYWWQPLQQLLLLSGNSGNPFKAFFSGFIQGFSDAWEDYFTWLSHSGRYRRCFWFCMGLPSKTAFNWLMNLLTPVGTDGRKRSGRGQAMPVRLLGVSLPQQSTGS